MGNQDNWTTPKALKIERAGEPRGTRRGPLKKGDRRKGIKARKDELLSSQRRIQWYADRLSEEHKRRQEHPELYRATKNGLVPWYPRWDEHFNRLQKLHKKLLDAALSDGIISEADSWRVENPI